MLYSLLIREIVIWHHKPKRELGSLRGDDNRSTELGLVTCDPGRMWVEVSEDLRHT